MRRLLSAAAATAAALTLASCSFGEPPEPESGEPPNLPTPSGEPQEQTSFMDVVAEDLEAPWGLDFLPDGTAIVGERATGRLLTIPLAEDGTAGEPQELRTVDIADLGEGGLLGLAVSPEYDTDSTVYAYYTTAADNRIAKIDTSTDAAPEPILTGIPTGPDYNGGALEFGPDGFLYAATGDGGDGYNAQDPESLGGKILRITPEGEPAPGNPDPGSPVFTLGHRNIEGLAWNSDGRLYATEVGLEAADEVNLIEPGGNYGWPHFEGAAAEDAYTDPVLTWEPFEAACAGAVFLEDTLVTACLRGQRLWTVRFDTDGAPAAEPQATAVNEFGRLRSVTMGPDGMLWVTTSNRDGQCTEERGCTPHETDDRIIRFATGYAAQGRV
ncbi:PQQ-dependent sugar dehydrogenase [Glycomyces tritici]|uniref:PQQ-dependent sugar dehydrogenase n=1 Tax=Glycomyces tritici TaxID=2665176 RepID=A0ABT7YLB9_9ACTN|nr:PQQ-dependent sugar dehydrogenase [Glycomyces tritici]MDN3239428.1 PQQ-dependent sugar dehydrogenase [Glycomyces tritici]